MELQEARRKWDLIFNDPLLSVTSLRQKAVSTNICQISLRSVCWKVYLTYFPSLETSTWSLALQKERQHYGNLQRKYITNPTEQMAKGGGDLSVNNPLAANDDNPWQQYFVDSEIRKVIRQDVERTFPDIDYFRDPRVQQRMVDILFIYCKMNQDVSYRQGMHEVLAPILWVIDLDSVEVVEGANDHDHTTNILLQTLDRAHVEHDAFSLFTQVMKTAKTWYEFNDEVFGSSRQRRPVKPSAVDESRIFATRDSASNEAAKLNPVVMECHKIHHEYLRTVDPQLYEHLERLGIEPQLYGIRWLRLLFGREFDMDNLLKLWDGMFAEDSTLKIVDYVCLSMLLRIRDELVDDDYSGCLGLLLHYPTATVHPSVLIEQAVYLREHLSHEGGVHVIRQNDVRAGRPPREHVPTGGSANHDGRPQLQQHHHHSSHSSHDSVQHENLSRMTKPASEGFARMTKDVMKSSQVRDINKAIAGVMDEVKKNVSILGENVLGRSSLDGMPTNLSSSQRFRSEFPPGFDRLPPSPSSLPLPPPLAQAPGATSYSSMSKRAPSPPTSVEVARNRQMGKLVEKCVEIFEREIFGADAPPDADSTSPGQTRDTAKEAALVLALVGLKHVRDVLQGKTTDFDPSIMDHIMTETANHRVVAAAAAAAAVQPEKEWEFVETDEAALVVGGSGERAEIAVGMEESVLVKVEGKPENFEATVTLPPTPPAVQIPKPTPPPKTSTAPSSPSSSTTTQRIYDQNAPLPPKPATVYSIDDILSDPTLASPLPKSTLSANDKYRWMLRGEDAPDDAATRPTSVKAGDLFGTRSSLERAGSTDSRPSPSVRRSSFGAHTAKVDPILGVMGGPVHARGGRGIASGTTGEVEARSGSGEVDPLDAANADKRRFVDEYDY